MVKGIKEELRKEEEEEERNQRENKWEFYKWGVRGGP
jgi:hypothetical protein